jgi:DNA invertase Pin-like site-specific DNA recombinase
MIRAAVYYRKPLGDHSTEADLCRDLQQAVRDRGGTLVATYVDDEEAPVRARNSQWKALLSNLGMIDQVVVASAGDLPGKNIRELLKVLGTLRDHGVRLYIHRDAIDATMGSAFAVLDTIDAFRRAKLSRAIRLGQARCVAAGKVIGRPPIRLGVRNQIRACLAEGTGIRPTARIFKVSPASVVNIRRSSATNL